MRNYEKFNIGDKVKIVRSHSDDIGRVGIITEVRPSFCKIDVNIIKQNGESWIRNHTYGQFELTDEPVSPPRDAFKNQVTIKK